MKKWKKLICLFLSAMMLLTVLTACGQESSQGGGASGSSAGAQSGGDADDGGIGISGEPYEIAVGVLTFTVDYFKEVAYGAIQAGEDLGVDVKIYTGQINTPADQVALIENQIQTGVDAITFTPVDVYGLATAVDECNDAGIVTVSEVDVYKRQVDHGDQMVQLEFGGAHGGLPHGALVNFAVAQDGIDVVVQTFQLHAQGDALSGGQTDAQRTRGHVYPRGVEGGVALEQAVRLAQSGHGLQGEIAPFRQYPVEHGGGVALAQHHPVLVLPIRVLGIEYGLIQIDYAENFTHGEGAAGVAGAGVVDRLEHVPAETAAQPFQFAAAG